MKTTRKEKLIHEIAAKHPDITVRPSWMSCDWNLTGIELEAKNASAGTIMSVARDDSDLDKMTDAAVMAWAASSVADFSKNCSKSHRRQAASAEAEL